MLASGIKTVDEFFNSKNNKDTVKYNWKWKGC